MTIYNIQNKKDLITVDLRMKQIRYVSGEDIKFFDISNDDVMGYEYLYDHVKTKFLDCVIEDLESNLGIKVNKKDLKFVKLQ